MHCFSALLMLAVFVAGASADLIITEINDGPLAPYAGKWIELTNTGPDAIPDLSLWELATSNNGSSLVTNHTQLPARSLAANESIVLAASSEYVETTWGITGVVHDPFPGGGSGFNGNDAILIVNTGANGSNPADIIDIYGALGVNGLGQPWEYTDSRSYRRAGITTASGPSFEEAEWVINPRDDTDGLLPSDMARIANPGAHNLHLLTLGTQRGQGIIPWLSGGISDTDLVNGIPPVIGGMGLHPSATGGSAVFTDGAANAANPDDGRLADANGTAQPTTMSWSFEGGPVFITGISIFAHSDVGDARMFINCHVHLDLTDDEIDNPTPYAELLLGGKGETSGGDTWGAVHAGIGAGTFGGDPAEVFNIRLEFFSVTDGGTGYRAEGMGVGGSIIKEVDILGQMNPVELSVFSQIR